MTDFKATARIPSISALLLALALSSCAMREKAADPFAAMSPFQRFNPLAPPSPLAVNVVAQWEKEFAQPGFLKPGDYWHTRQGRDELTYRLILLCDYRFSRYEADLVLGKATNDTFVDLAVLGLSSAGALIQPGQATRILAAISGGLISSRATIQKNFFQNQAQPVLLQKMRVLRQQEIFTITRRLRKYGTDVYPTERALIDVLEYYNRGTILRALQEISADTSAQELALRGGKIPPLPSDALEPAVAPISSRGGGDKRPEPPPRPSAPEEGAGPQEHAAPRTHGRPASDEVQARRVALVRRLGALAPGEANAVLAALGQPAETSDDAARRAVKQLILSSHDAAAVGKIEAAMPAP